MTNLILISNIFFILFTFLAAWLYVKWLGKQLSLLKDPLIKQRENQEFNVLPRQPYEEIDLIVSEINLLGQKLEKGKTTLETHNQQLLTIFNSLNEGVAAFNNNGIAILHNLAFRKILGISDTYENGIRFYDWIHFPPIIQDIEEFVENGKPIKKRSKFYGDRFIEYQVSPLKMNDKPLTGFLLTIVDVTQLQQLETIRQDFVANVTHEFKTPLTSIRGYAETLLGGNVDSKKMRNNFLKKIERQTIHLENLVSDLLQLSHIERRKSIELVKLNPLPLIKKIITEFLPSIKEKKQTFYEEIEKAEHKIKIVANKNLLHTIVSNLLSNAIQYTPENGSIWFRFKVKKSKIRIEVEDNGPGIPKNERERIFERFYRLNEARAVYAEGSGLGLSIVKHSVELIGSKLGVESELDKGSLFWVEIPTF